jgi:hypothetical protein
MFLKKAILTKPPQGSINVRATTGSCYVNPQYNTHSVPFCLSLFRTVLNRSVPIGEGRGNLLGTHTLRKTGYLFATYGVLNYSGMYNTTCTDVKILEYSLASESYVDSE